MKRNRKNLIRNTKKKEWLINRMMPIYRILMKRNAISKKKK